MAFRRILGELNSEVLIATADGSDAKNLTNNPSFDGWPSWSPDGSEIAFASNRRADVRLVANTEGRATTPLWPRDGKSIYFPNCRKVDLGSDCQIFVTAAPLTPPQRTAILSPAPEIARQNSSLRRSQTGA